MNPIRGATDVERVTLSRRHKAGELHRIRTNAYYPADQWRELDDDAKRRLRHITAADARAGMVLVGRSAALVHGLEILDADGRWRDDPDRDPNNDIIELAHPTRRRSTTIRDVRESPLAWGPEDLVRIDGRPQPQSPGSPRNDRHGLGDGRKCRRIAGAGAVHRSRTTRARASDLGVR